MSEPSSGPWTPDLVLVSEPQGGHIAATGLGGLSDIAGRLGEIIDQLRRVPWEGQAADAFLDYLYSLRKVAIGTQDVARDCRNETGRAADTLVALHQGPATDTAERLNAAYAQAEEMTADGTNLGEAVQLVVMRIGADEDLGRVREQRDEALDRLVTAIKTQEEKLLNLEAPRPPDASTISDPQQRAAVEELSRELSSTLAAAGDSERARELADQIAATDNDTARRALLRQAADELSAAELDYLLDHMDTDDLYQALGAGGIFGFDPEDTAAQRELYNAIAAKVDLDTLHGLADQLPEDYWHPDPLDGVAQIGTDLGPFGDNLAYVPLPGAGQPVTPQSIDPADIEQSGLGDCHLQATLHAMASTPHGRETLGENIQLNSNGTYTVTLYRNDGTSVPVVVTPDTPVQRTDSGWESTYNNNRELWVQLYEKAFAQTNAELSQQPPLPGAGQNEDRGYPGLNGGWAAEDHARLTGHPPERVTSADLSEQQLRQAQQDGRPITVSTGDSNPPLVSGHVYSVDRVDWSHDPPMVHLHNPWGHTHAAIPLDELQANTQTVNIGRG